MTRSIGWVIAIGGLALVGSATLFPHPGDAYQAAQTPFWCLVCGSLGAVDVVLNILLFVPYGMGLRLAGLSRPRALATAALTTLIIESLQWRLIAGRDASLSDLLTNTLGGLVGILLADHWRSIIFPPSSSSRRLGHIAAGAWPALWLLCGWSLGLALPQTIWWGQWAPELGQFEPFPGTVLAARLGAMELPPRRLENSRELRERLLTDSVSIEAATVPGGLTGDLAPIVSVFDEHQTEVLLLGQNGTDLVFRIRRRVAAAELRSPAIRLPGVFDRTGAAPDTVQLTAGLDHRRMFLRLTRRDLTTVYREVSPSPSWGWSFLVPYEYALGPEARWLTALWIAGLLIPATYWSARGVRRDIVGLLASDLTGSVPVAAGVVLGLGLVPPLLGLPPVHWSEWVAAGGGMTAGWWLGRRRIERLRD